MNVCVIIPAAGRSLRFGESDKLSQDVGGRPLLVRTVEIFAKRDEVRSIIVAGPPEPEDAWESFRERYAPTLGFHGAVVVKGGATERWETVRNALASVPDDATHVAVHDAARPAVSRALLDRVFEAAKALGAVVPAVPVADTLKRVTAEAQEITPGDEEDALAGMILGEAGQLTVSARSVEATVDRHGVWAVQTPQVFRAELLRRAYEQDDLRGATDDASLVERLGEPVHVVEGEAANIKVTTAGDLRLLRAILGVSAPAERPVHKRF